MLKRFTIPYPIYLSGGIVGIVLRLQPGIDSF